MRVFLLLTMVGLLAGCANRPGYHVDFGRVTYTVVNHTGPRRFEMPQADAKTFRVISETPGPFARDAKHVYLGPDRIEGADPETFEPMATDRLSRDRSHVFRGGQVVSDEPEHFQALHGYWSKDGQNVYYEWKKVPGLRPDSLRVINIRYAHDGQTLCVHGQPVKVSTSLGDIRFLETPRGEVSDFWSDGESVYFNNVRLAPEKNFEVLSLGFARTPKEVWWGPEKVDGADPATFEVVDGRGRDKNRVYDQLPVRYWDTGPVLR